jgi:hypothetical protein
MWQLELRNIYLSQDIKSVSELYRQRMYKKPVCIRLDYISDCIRALSVPMHLGLEMGPLCPII